MSHLIPAAAMERYTAAPSPTTVTAVQSLHTSIRATLGDRYETLLQGSYKNDTSIPDLNDVDIVAIRRWTTSSVFTGVPAINPISWETILDEVQRTLEGSHLYRGKTEKRDKCINVATGFNADVVPAIAITNIAIDPIAIFSRGAGTERKNFPREHYQHGVEKHQNTSQRFKPTVRMFKRWVANTFTDDSIAPSFYVECLIYNFVDAAFYADTAQRFVHCASVITGLNYAAQRIMTVAGDKDIFVDSEWNSIRFETFRRQLAVALEYARRALAAPTEGDALRAWRRVFNE